MTVVLIILNILVGLAFLAAGGMKLALPPARLVDNGLRWVTDFPVTAVRLIGAAEVLGGIGLIVPLLTRIAPVLAPAAAVCLVAIMVGAVVVHVRRQESPVPPAVLGVLSLVSAVMGFALL